MCGRDGMSALPPSCTVQQPPTHPLVSSQAPPPQGCECFAYICFACKFTPAWIRTSGPQVHQLQKVLLLSRPYINSNLGFVFFLLRSLEKDEGHERPLRRG